MAEASTTEVVTKSKTEYTPVTMTDGRVVQFAGKRKMLKDVIFDESKIELDSSGNLVQISAGAIKTRYDFRNGETRTYTMNLKLLAQFAGHGDLQKRGDELAAPADKALSEEDMVIALDDQDQDLSQGRWGKSRAEGGGGVAGAGVVIQALLQVTNDLRAKAGKPPMDLAGVKAYIQKRLDADKDLTRRALYNSFRVEGTATGDLIKQLEANKVKKEAKVDANAEAAALAESE